MGGSAVIIGGAVGAFDEYQAARAMLGPHHIICTNQSMVEFPGEYEHGVSFHCEVFPYWIDKRRKSGRPMPRKLWTGVARRIPVSLPEGFETGFVENWGGSSGLLGVTVALQGLGCDRVILCGVPLTREGSHYHDEKSLPWRDALLYRKGWMARAEEMADKVKSMSGWTKQLLGAPTAEWIGAEEVK